MKTILNSIATLVEMWTQASYAAHLARVGQYEAAKKVFE